MDVNGEKYIDGLKEYRENQKTEKLVSLMNQEIEDYYTQCKYFTNEKTTGNLTEKLAGAGIAYVTARFCHFVIFF